MRYELKDCQIFVFVEAFFRVFCVFLREKGTGTYNFDIFVKVKEGTTTLVSWEILSIDAIEST